jgi:hypothetical protein
MRSARRAWQAIDLTWDREPIGEDALPFGLWAFSLDARLMKRLRQRPGSQAASVLLWCFARPMSADRALAAKGRTARACGGSEPGGGARDVRRSPADERPAMTLVRTAFAILLRNE